MNRRVYVVDDDTHVRQYDLLLRDSLDYACRSFDDGESFLAEMSRLEPGAYSLTSACLAPVASPCRSN
jgi:FixJ family two-component response regulator